MRLAVGLARLSPALLLGIGLALALALLEGLRIPRARQLRARWAQRVLAGMARALPYRYRVIGAPPTKPMLWVSNHVSWADVVVLGQLAPLIFVSKADVRRWPLMGWLATRGGTLFIRRGGGESGQLRATMARHLRRGGSLAVFPEGTTTDGRGTATFHGRLLGAAIEAQTGIQPVAVRYLRDDALDPSAAFIGDDDLWGHLKRLLGRPAAVVEIHLLAPLDSLGHDRSSLARAARQAIDQVLCPSPAAVSEAA